MFRTIRAGVAGMFRALGDRLALDDDDFAGDDTDLNPVYATAANVISSVHQTQATPFWVNRSDQDVAALRKAYNNFCRARPADYIPELQQELEARASDERRFTEDGWIVLPLEVHPETVVVLEALQAKHGHNSPAEVIGSAVSLLKLLSMRKTYIDAGNAKMRESDLKGI